MFYVRTDTIFQCQAAHHYWNLALCSQLIGPVALQLRCLQFGCILEYFRYFAGWIIVSKVPYNWFYLYALQFFFLILIKLNMASSLTNIHWGFWTAYTLSVQYFLTDTAVRYRNITVTVRLWHESYYLCVCVCLPSDVYVMDCVCVSGPHFLCVCDNHWLSVVLYAGKSPLALIYYLHFPTACNFLQTDVETDRQTDRQTGLSRLE